MAPVLAVLLVLCAGTAAAQTVTLQGMLGRKALLIVDGSPPKAVGPGETHRGVRVLSTSGDEAVLEVGGRQQTLRVGEAPASVGAGAAAPGRGQRIVLPVGSGGHFVAQGAIDGKPVQFLVDTGASHVALGARQAERLGIDYKSGQPGRSSTANGIVPTWQVRLRSVRIGDVEVFDVEASVLPAEMPVILLGNSFLNRFRMRREHDQLVLERRF